MAKEITTEITIKASPEKVWNILTDFENYPNWNPFIKSLSGKVAVGKKINVKLEPPGSKAMIFKPTVLAFNKNKELRWLGQLVFRGLFDGEHKFEITDNGNGTSLFRQSEKFNGVLIPLYKKMLDTNTVDGFNQMNQKLKELAEKTTPTFSL